MDKRPGDAKSVAVADPGRTGDGSVSQRGELGLRVAHQPDCPVKLTSTARRTLMAPTSCRRVCARATVLIVPCLPGQASKQASASPSASEGYTTPPDSHVGQLRSDRVTLRRERSVVRVVPHPGAQV